MLLIHVAIDQGGQDLPIFIDVRGEVVVLVDGDAVRPLPPGALAAVMRRYGKPLEEPVTRREDTLALGDGATLSRFRHLATFDVIAKDWLLYEAPNEEPVAELATAVTAALSHLARAAESSAASA